MKFEELKNKSRAMDRGALLISHPALNNGFNFGVKPLLESDN